MIWAAGRAFPCNLFPKAQALLKCLAASAGRYNALSMAKALCKSISGTIPAAGLKVQEASSSIKCQEKFKCQTQIQIQDFEVARYFVAQTDAYLYD